MQEHTSSSGEGYVTGTEQPWEWRFSWFCVRLGHDEKQIQEKTPISGDRLSSTSFESVAMYYCGRGLSPGPPVLSQEYVQSYFVCIIWSPLPVPRPISFLLKTSFLTLCCVYLRFFGTHGPKKNANIFNKATLTTRSSYLAKEKKRLYSVVRDVARMCRTMDFFCPSRYLRARGTGRPKAIAQDRSRAAYISVRDAHPARPASCTRMMSTIVFEVGLTSFGRRSSSISACPVGKTRRCLVKNTFE